MMKIVISTATTLMAAAVLVACNGSGTNSSDATSAGSAPISKAVCTSLNNWQSVGLGMSASQVEARLGKPATITATSAQTTYTYERCRAGNFLEKEAVAATSTEPATPAEYRTYYFGGSLTLNAIQGVTSVTTPVLNSDKPMACEWDLYTYPSNYGGGDIFVCRTAANPF
jgi:outer membrane protein assembly factor BamE (lipoprotein component of BamABCDE complex)